MAGKLATRDLSADGLVVNHVSKSFTVNGSSFQAVRDVSIHVRQGEFVSIVGPSGCGKSTILRMLAGLETADSEGSLSADGKTINGPSIERGIVFQDHRLLPWLTIGRNVKLALQKSRLETREKDLRVAEILKLVGLHDFADAYPHQLSGGMSQRAALARSLVSRPKVLLLDEPLGALDSLTRQQMQSELLRIWRHYRITALMVTHDVDEAVLLSNRVIVMAPRPGRVKGIVDIAGGASIASPAFLEARSQIYALLGDGA